MRSAIRSRPPPASSVACLLASYSGPLPAPTRRVAGVIKLVLAQRSREARAQLALCGRMQGQDTMKVRRLCAGRLVAQCCRQAVWAADCGAAGGVWPQEEVGEHALEGGRGHLHAQVRVQLTRGRLSKANTHVSAANSVEVEKSKCRRPVKDFWTPC